MKTNHNDPKTVQERIIRLKESLENLEKGLINSEFHPIAMDNHYRIASQISKEIRELELNPTTEINKGEV